MHFCLSDTATFHPKGVPPHHPRCKTRVCRIASDVFTALREKTFADVQLFIDQEPKIFF